MYNCLFVDSDLNLRTRIDRFIQHDDYGYFIDLKVYKKDVPDLVLIDITPKYKEDGTFFIRSAINNTTKITINGIKLTNLSNPSIGLIQPSKILIKEICLKRYSKSTRRSDKKAQNRSCFATKMIFTIKLNKRR